MKTGLASICQSRFFNTDVDIPSTKLDSCCYKTYCCKTTATLIASYLNAKSSFLTISAPALKALSLPLAT